MKSRQACQNEYAVNAKAYLNMGFSICLWIQFKDIICTTISSQLCFCSFFSGVTFHSNFFFWFLLIEQNKSKILFVLLLVLCWQWCMKGCYYNNNRWPCFYAFGFLSFALQKHFQVVSLNLKIGMFCSTAIHSAVELNVQSLVTAVTRDQ